MNDPIKTDLIAWFENLGYSPMVGWTKDEKGNLEFSVRFETEQSCKDFPDTFLGFKVNYRLPSGPLKKSDNQI